MTNRGESRFNDTSAGEGLGVQAAVVANCPTSKRLRSLLAGCCHLEAGKALLWGHYCVTVAHNLISRFSKVSFWESLMKSLVITSEAGASIRSRQILACSSQPAKHRHFCSKEERDQNH